MPLFAFPASAALQKNFADFQAAFAGDSLPVPPQAALAVELTQRYGDEIVDALVLNLARGGNQDGQSSGLLETVGSMIKSTTHGLIRQILGKMDNAELKPVADFIATRRTQVTDAEGTRDYISFTLSDADHALLHSAWSAAANGQPDTAAMTTAMLRFCELAIQAFYVETGQAVKMGFIVRNLFQVGQATISKGSRSAITRLVPGMRPKDMQAFAGYFVGMLRSA